MYLQWRHVDYPNAPRHMNDDPNWLMYTDVALRTVLYMASHNGTSEEISAGSNCLYVDGAVVWHNRSELTVESGPWVVDQWTPDGWWYMFPDTSD